MMVALVGLALIAVPLAGAFACRVATGDRAGWRIAAVALGITTALAAWFALLLTGDVPAATRIGTELPGPSVTVRSDAISAAVGLLDALLTFGVLAYTRTAGPHGTRFYEAYLVFTAAVFGVVLTGDLVVIYGCLLALIWATGRLVATSDKPRAAAAAVDYRRTAVAAATLYLVGVLLAATVSGATDGQLLGAALQERGYDDPLVLASFASTTVGLAALVGLVPLHGWLVDTHANATDPVSALISGVLPAAAVYVFARVLFDVFTVEFLAVNPTVARGILYGALASLLVGNLLAYGQRDVKGMLAYSTVSQFGLVAAGLLVATERAVFGAILHVFGHGVVKGALCLIAGILAVRFDARTRAEYAGLAKQAPVVGAAFAVLGIAIIGLPPTVGFVGKWYIALGAAEEGLWLVVAVVVGSTLLTLGYVLPFLDRLYFGAFDGADDPAGVSAGMVGVVVAGAIVAVSVGVASIAFQSALQSALEGLVAVPGG